MTLASLLTDGTSFSAPLVTAVAAEVVARLMNEPTHDFQKLEPSLKIKIVKTILLSSQRRGTLDGLRALRLAENLRPSIASAEAFKVDTNPVCQAKDASVDTLRQKISLCDDLAASERRSILEKLTLDELQNQNFQSAMADLNELVDLVKNDPSAQGSEVKWIQQFFKELRNGMESTTAWLRLERQFAEPAWLNYFLPSLIKTDVDSAQHWLYVVLTSTTFEHYMARGPNHGSDVWLETVLDNLNLFQAKTSEIQSLALIKSVLDFDMLSLDSRDLYQVNSDYFLTAIRLLQALQNDSRFMKLRSDLANLAHQVFLKLDQTPAYFSTTDYINVLGRRQEPTWDYVDAFVKDQFDLKSLFSTTESITNHTDNVFVLYLLELNENPDNAPNLPTLLQWSSWVHTNKIWSHQYSVIDNLLADLIYRNIQSFSSASLSKWLTTALDLSPALVLALDQDYINSAQQLITILKANKSAPADLQARLLAMLTSLKFINAAQTDSPRDIVFPSIALKAYSARLSPSLSKALKLISAGD